MAVMTKPDARMVRALKTHLQGVWKDAHQNWKDIDTYYNLTFKLWAQGIDRASYHSPRSRAIIDAAVDNQLSGTPKVKRPQSGKAEIHAVRADRIEPFLVAILDEVALLETSPTWKQIAKHLLLYGYTILEGPVLTMVERPDEPDADEFDDNDEFRRAMHIFENQKKAWMPFRMRAPHPSKVLLDPSSKQPREAIVIAKRYAWELEELTGGDRVEDGRALKQFEVKEGANPYELVTTTEYWSKDWHALLIREELYIIEENEWGFVPYQHAFSGFGIEETSTDFNPRQLAVGMLDFIREALRVQSRSQSGRHDALVEAAYMPWGTPKNAAEIAEHLRRGDIVPGIRKGDLFKVEGTDLPGWLFKAEDIIEKELELSTFSSQLSGIREEGVSTVGQQAILTTAAGRKFVMPQKQIENLATIATSHVLQLIDVVLEESITVRGNTIKPSDIEHDYSVLVSFDLVDPVLQLQRRELGMREVQQGLKSDKMYWEVDANLEDATGEEQQLRIERVKKSPETMAKLDAQAAREIGLDELIESPIGAEVGTDGPIPVSPGADGKSLAQTQGGGGPPGRQGLTNAIPKPQRVPAGVL